LRDLIICPRCAAPLPDWLLRDSHSCGICLQCQSALEVYAFPALYRRAEKLELSQLSLAEGEACCYEHSSKKAVALCSNCGRFLCALCEVQLGGEVLCPDCLHRVNAKSPRASLETQRTLYDSIALALATWPLLIFYFTVITAPLSLGMAIYAWKRPTSIVRHNRWRLFTALILSSLEIAALVGVVIFLIYAAQRRLKGA
jgi:hypothetical protein